MTKFKRGDVVVVIDDIHYTITGNGSWGKVIEVTTTGYIVVFRRVFRPMREESLDYYYPHYIHKLYEKLQGR